MSIMSGLVETNGEQQPVPMRAGVAEWTVRNAWTVVIGTSLVFWLGFAMLLVFG